MIKLVSISHRFILSIGVGVSDVHCVSVNHEAARNVSPNRKDDILVSLPLL